MSAESELPIIVNVAWLQEQITKDNQNIRIVDGTWHNPIWNRDAEAEYLQQHIVGAVRFNIDDISDKSALLPRSIPNEKEFETHIRKLGISNDHHVIIYDNNDKYGMYSAARVWYMFKLFGHNQVSILDGGLPKWLTKGGPVVSGPHPNVKTTEYKASYQPQLYSSFDDTFKTYSANPSLIIDARSNGRFNGTLPEPNPKIPSGHIVNTINIPFVNFFNSETKTLKNKDQIQLMFHDASVDMTSPIVASCGSGITACWITVAAWILGKQVPVYVGSWLEWFGKGPETSKVLGIKGEDILN